MSGLGLTPDEFRSLVYVSLIHPALAVTNMPPSSLQSRTTNCILISALGRCSRTNKWWYIELRISSLSLLWSFCFSSSGIEMCLEKGVWNCGHSVSRCQIWYAVGLSSAGRFQFFLSVNSLCKWLCLKTYYRCWPPRRGSLLPTLHRPAIQTLSF